MKKSTLITTIAMIVVVVVALSTATYAWFSSSTSATATSTITTSATGDWSMIKGVVTQPTTASATAAGVTFQTGSTSSITLSDSMKSGLFAPYAEITSAFSAATAAVNITSLASFMDAQITGTDTLVTGKYDGSSGAEGVPGYKLPDAIRVINTSSSSKTLVLNVTINAGQQTDLTSSYYAGKALRFYVATKSASLDGKFTNGYTPSDAASKEVYDSQEANTAAATIAAGTAVAKSTVGVTGQLDYTAGDPVAEYTAAVSADEKLGIAAGDHVYTYTITIGTVNQGTAVNVLIYTWLDGWLADASAAAANFTVCYGFTSAA